ncbi:4'-phosphopantetheinyl transferase superfamily protein [Leadbetterella sp. DM7]|uniref:4'-phosphopantetheinyl transferase family protein n=1 Tax=Leadbetterella sp. DM7 TaxID=3235085 RepID=UPI00349EC1F1
MSLFSNITLENGLQIVVWNLSETLEELQELTPLTPEEKEAWDAISVPAKKREFLAGKYVLEKACRLLNIAYGGMEKDEHGKPHLAGRKYEISLTHTEDFIAVVFSGHCPVGIDLEKPREQIFRILPRLYSPEEVAAVNGNLDTATIYWSAKEALYKLYGKRSVDFKKHLRLSGSGGQLRGLIDINGTRLDCRFYITRIGEYYLVVAY